jgi:hypothetical protein
VISRSSRRLAPWALLALIAPLAACSGVGPVANGELDGCLAADRGTIAIGVTNTAGEPLAISAVDLADGSTVEIIDRFIATDDEARETPVVFSVGGRAEFGGVDLDQASIDPGGAAFVGIEVERVSAAEGTVTGLLVTADGTERAVPVTLALGGNCG